MSRLLVVFKSEVKTYGKYHSLQKVYMLLLMVALIYLSRLIVVIKIESNCQDFFIGVRLQ